MSDKITEAGILVIDGHPIAHAPSEYGYAETLMARLIEECGGKISVDPGVSGYESGDITDVSEAFSWCDYHAGHYSFIGDVYDANENKVYPYILGSQWYAYEFPEHKEEIDRYCVENGLTRPDNMYAAR